MYFTFIVSKLFKYPQNLKFYNHFKNPIKNQNLDII